MASTYHVTVEFDRDEDGNLVPGQGKEAPTAFSAMSRARAALSEHAGAVAFSRTGNPATGEFSDPVVLLQIGEVDLDALCE